MARRAFGLHFRSPLHVGGEQGVGQENTLDYIPSDTLFSALFITWLEMPAIRQAALEWCKQVTERDVPLRITSAFPFVGQTLLLPRPRLAIAPEASVTGTTSTASDGQYARSGKKYKKVRWVSLPIFTQFIQSINAQQLGHAWEKAHLIQGGSTWLDEAGWLAEKSGLVMDDNGAHWFAQSGQTPHVAVDRWSSASNLFHVGRAHFAPGCGLWFMADGEESWLEHIEHALHLLGDSGIGGQRSRGNGQFTVQTIKPPSLAETGRDANCAVLLSRTAPREGEMALLRHDLASYDLVNVGGYCASLPIIRCRVRMLTEGSVIGPCAAVGQMVDVKPESRKPQVQQAHAILRYGYGFVVSMQQGG